MAFDPADVDPPDGLAPLSPRQVAAFLRAARDHIVVELSTVGDEWARWRPAPGEWSANECLGHIIEADSRGFAGRIGRILIEDGVAEVGWDQIAVAAARRDAERSVAEILEEFLAGRNPAIDLLEGLEPDQMDRFAIHDRVGRVTVRELLHEWVFHDRNHIRQLLANTQARAWPAMGNTATRTADPSAGSGSVGLGGRTGDSAVNRSFGRRRRPYLRCRCGARTRERVDPARRHRLPRPPDSGCTRGRPPAGARRPSRRG